MYLYFISQIYKNVLILFSFNLFQVYSHCNKSKNLNTRIKAKAQNKIKFVYKKMYLLPTLINLIIQYNYFYLYYIFKSLATKRTLSNESESSHFTCWNSK